ncbi:MAG: leucine-rich repeat domain-containing protein [Prevotella sp.]|nr:leucine-rich repeat domain-containing protein [Prevotella sp.]
MNKLTLKTGELLTVLLLFCFAPARAEDFTAESSGTTFYYNILTDGGNAVEVTYYAIGANANSAAYTGSLQIPSSVTNDGTTYSVTRIGERAFNGCSGITSVEIPSSITCIRDSAFVGCSGLATVTFVETSGLTTIENKAFYNCSSLSSITIPTSVTGLGDYAFYGCSKLASITVPSSVTSIGSYTFYNCSSLTSITIPDNVTSIGSNAFYGCGFTSITLPSTVTSIGSSAFAACTKLTSIDIPSSVTSIGGSAFYGCSGLTSISIPSGVTSIGALVFRECTALTKIEVDESNSSYCSEDGVLFTNDKKELMQYPLGSTLAEYEVPAAVETIDERAFAYCASDLTSVTLGNSVATIGSYAFYSCKGLKLAAFGGAEQSIGDYAFRLCSSLAEVYNLASTAATCGKNVFNGLPSNSTLYVLADNARAFEAYSGDGYGWDYFTVASTLSIPVTMKEDESTYYGTYYNGACGYTMPEALIGYTVTVNNDSIIALNKAYEGNSVVPAGTPLLLKSSSSTTYSANIATGGETTENESMMYGTDTAGTTTYAVNDSGEKTTEGYLFYKLTTLNGENLGFYWGADNGAAFTVPTAHKAWLAVPVSDDGSTIKLSGFSFDDAGETTGIQSVEAETATFDGAIYNIAGQRVNSMTRRGVYIVNGKKVIKK